MTARARKTYCMLAVCDCFIHMALSMKLYMKPVFSFRRFLQFAGYVVYVKNLTGPLPLHCTSSYGQEQETRLILVFFIEPKIQLIPISAPGAYIVSRELHQIFCMPC